MKVTSKGQITIPKKLRKKYGITSRTEIEVADSGGRLVIRKLAPADAVDRVYGMLKSQTRWGRTDELIERLRGGL